MSHWKDVNGYEGIYKVSRLGEVKSLDRVIKVSRNGIEYEYPIKGKVLSPTTDIYGYKIVSLSVNGKTKKAKVHRLVAKAFIENTHSYPVINHKNEMKSDNRVENLEWCSVEHNNKYNDRVNKIAIKNSIPVKATNLKTGETKIFSSARETNKYGFQQGNVTSCCKGKLSQHKGYRWEYAGKVAGK